MGGLQIIMTLSGERPALKKVFEYPPEKTRKLESYIRPVETRTTNISGGNNPRLVLRIAHVRFDVRCNKVKMFRNEIFCRWSKIPFRLKFR